MPKITAKVIKFSHHRKLNIDGRTSEVWNYKMKDQYGNKTYFGFWGARSNAFAKVGSVLEFVNLKVDKYPNPPQPRNLFTIGSTRFKILADKATLNVFDKVGEHDGYLEEYSVDIVFDVSCYKSCPNCTKKIYNQEDRTCSKCKEVLTTLCDDFRFKLYLTKEDSYEEVQGFRKGLSEFGKIIFDNLDTKNPGDIEEKLNEVFGGKKINVEFTLNDGQKMLHRLFLEPNKSKYDIMII